MAPKDESSTGSGRSYQDSLLLKDDTNENNDGIDADYENGHSMDSENRDGDWKHKLLRTLREFWKDEGLFSPSSNSKWVVGTATFLLAAAAAYHQSGKGRGRIRQDERRHRGRERSIPATPFQSTAPDRVDLVRRRQPRPSWMIFLWKLLSGKEGSSQQMKTIVDVSLSMLQAAARQGQVQKAMVGPGEILYQDRNSTKSLAWKRTRLPSNSPRIQSDLLELLTSNGCEEVSALPESLASRLAGPLLAALPFVYLALVYKIFKNIHNGGNDMRRLTGTNNKTISTRFSDVAGLDPIMPEVQEIVYYLRHPTAYQALGAKPPRGILLHGAPGTGKTLLARAVAGEAEAAFLPCSGSEFCEMYVGRGAARVRALFDEAKRQALKRSGQSWWNRFCSLNFSDARQSASPTAIIFIDEFDALAKSRAYGGLHGNDERESTLNQLLTEMDGFGSSNEEDRVTIILIAATNRADVLDPAILRRFDRQIHVSYPDAAGRRGILLVHASSTNCEMKLIDWELLASDAWTGQLSGSDLRNIVNDAALLAVREKSPCVQQQHLEQAIRRSRAMKNQADLIGRGYLLFAKNNNH